jgi:diguanylate cyclase (GGDEF)-like protein
MYVGFALALLTIHALVLKSVRLPVGSSDLLLELAAVVACVACYGRSRACTGTARKKWGLVAAGLLSWVLGQTMTTYSETVLHLSQAPTAIDSDFYFFLFGIPLLLAISSANESKESRTFLWIDGLQALIAVYLVRLQLFPGVSGSPAQDAISAMRMTYAYDAENFILVLTVMLRVLTKPQGEDRHLYRTLFAFLSAYAAAAAGLNYLAVARQVPTGTYYDLLWDAPFLLVTVLVALLPSPSEADGMADQTWAGMLVTSASPIFFTMALLMMGVCVARTRFEEGAAAITFALLSYGCRNSLLQSQYMRTERKLLESETVIRQANQQLEQLSFLDGLTGVPNRRRFEEVLALEWNRSQRSGAPLSLLVVDIDHFKLLNDSHGHLHGDACLIDTARALGGCLCRAGEVLARYGGEEFAAILPGVDEEQALVVAEQMREAVERMELANEKAPEKRLTVSIGVAVNGDLRTRGGRDLFALADQALYRAKSSGRNRVHANAYEGASDGLFSALIAGEQVEA